MATQRHGYGNSKVLAPKNRNLENAYAVSRWLVEKAAAHLRRDGRTAGEFIIQLSCMPRGWWTDRITSFSSRDTMHFQELNRILWRRFYKRTRCRFHMSVGARLGRVAMLEDRLPDLFLPIPLATRTDREKLGAAVDNLNRRFGPDTVTFGKTLPHYGFFDRG